jgi:tetratricopeptide (TPR) repeat protein
MQPVRFIVLMFLAASLAAAQSEVPTTADPQKVEADKLYNEGNSLFRSGNYAGAIEKYKAALAIAKDYKYYYQLGLAYKNSRQTDQALAALEESVKAKTDFAIGYNALGSTYLASNVYDKAIEAFKQALKYNPSLDQSKKGIEEAYAGKIQELSDGGKYEDAGAMADEALATYKDNPKLYLLAARIYNRLSQPEKAISAAQKAIELKKRGGKGAEYFEIGIAYKQLKDYAKAREAFNEAKKDAAYSRNAQYELDGLKGR